MLTIAQLQTYPLLLLRPNVLALVTGVTEQPEGRAAKVQFVELNHPERSLELELDFFLRCYGAAKVMAPPWSFAAGQMYQLTVQLEIGTFDLRIEITSVREGAKRTDVHLVYKDLATGKTNETTAIALQAAGTLVAMH